MRAFTQSTGEMVVSSENSCFLPFFQNPGPIRMTVFAANWTAPTGPSGSGETGRDGDLTVAETGDILRLLFIGRTDLSALALAATGPS